LLVQFQIVETNSADVGIDGDKEDNSFGGTL